MLKIVVESLAVNQVATVLVPLTVLDFATGYLASLITKTTSSKIGTNGLYRKALVYLSIFAVAVVQMVLPEFPWLIEVFITFYIIVEVTSILENLTRAGVPLPKQITNLFKEQLDKYDKGQDNETTE